MSTIKNVIAILMLALVTINVAPAGAASSDVRKADRWVIVFENIIRTGNWDDQTVSDFTRHFESFVEWIERLDAKELAGLSDADLKKAVHTLQAYMNVASDILRLGSVGGGNYRSPAYEKLGTVFDRATKAMMKLAEEQGRRQALIEAAKKAAGQTR